MDMAADVAHRVGDQRSAVSNELTVYNRHLTFILAALFVLPALAATAQEIRDSMGGRFVVGQDGTPYLVMADGLRGVFVDGPDGTPYLVMGNRLRGALVDGSDGAASPITGDGIGARTAFGPSD
jgi:hypothetical protein